MNMLEMGGSSRRQRSRCGFRIIESVSDPGAFPGDDNRSYPVLSWGQFKLQAVDRRNELERAIPDNDDTVYTWQSTICESRLGWVSIPVPIEEL